MCAVCTLRPPIRSRIDVAYLGKLTHRVSKLGVWISCGFEPMPNGHAAFRAVE